MAPDTQVMLWRAAWLTAAAIALWHLAANGRTALRQARFLAAAVIAGVLATVVVQQPVEFVATPVQWRCAPGPPRVCVAAEYEDQLGTYAEALGRMAPIADQVGLPRPPDGYQQAVGVSPGPGSSTSMHGSR